MTLSELHEKCKKCKKCGLRAGAKQVVPGEGNPNAEIMFIGEAPGRQEDLQGIPFCGPAGKVLNQLLAHIGLNRSDIFIANMIKCRPPNNRDPFPDELKECQPWLDSQIEIINPKVFVPLGRFAMSKFVPGLKISDAHGSSYKRGDKVYFIMYHPAVALYKASLKEVLLKDMEKLKQVLDGKIQPESLDSVVDEALAKLAKHKINRPKQKGFDL